MIKYLTLVLMILSINGKAQDFDFYFTGKVLRVDFMFAGNSSKTLVYPVSLKEEAFWGGPRSLPAHSDVPGNFRYELFDQATGRLIYTRGFGTLFQEWQTTAEAKTMERSFYEVATMPFPKAKCRFVLSKRERDGKFSGLYESEIDPADYFISRERPKEVKTSLIYGTGKPERSVDLAFIAEGYTESEMEKFRADVKMMADALFEEPPFNEYKDKINIWGVESVSMESGTDIPGEGVYLNTVLNSNFYTFNLDRYLTTTDIKSVNDYAAAVPHDNIIVLMNSERYGGGGVYNYYSGTTVDHPLSKIVFIHEFGHGFAGLADEYYSSSVAYDEFYPLDVEPWEPNITTRVNFESKWQKLIKPGIPVPTPEEEKYLNVTGLFEGGGYSAKGIFRPEFDCRMKSNSPKGFCSVCREAVRETIEHYIR